MLSDHENYFVEVVGRTASGEPEFIPTGSTMSWCRRARAP